MSITKIKESIFYVYQLRVNNRDLPFYVGKGHGARAWDHFKPDGVNPHKDNTIKKAIRENNEIVVEFLESGLSEPDANRYEKLFISAYGRKDLRLGGLTNLTDGGEGTKGILVSDKTRMKLSLANRSNVESFIKSSKVVHGDKYLYSNANYINNNTKVAITCSIHGDFYQSPSNHLTGFGCPHCGRNIKYTNEEFIHKAKLVHGDRFSYVNTEYLGLLMNVSIECNKHGNFIQNAGAHLSGSGCAKCYSERRILNPWLDYNIISNSTSMKIWLDSDVIFNIWESNSNIGSIKLSKLYCGMSLSRATFHTLIKRYKSGWIPSKDIHWLHFKELYANKENPVS